MYYAHIGNSVFFWRWRTFNTPQGDEHNVRHPGGAEQMRHRRATAIQNSFQNECAIINNSVKMDDDEEVTADNSNLQQRSDESISLVENTLGLHLFAVINHGEQENHEIDMKKVRDLIEQGADIHTIIPQVRYLFIAQYCIVK